MRRKRTTWFGPVAALILVSAAGCSTVPVTGRSQLLLMSDDELAGMGADSYQKVLSESTLSQDPAQVNMVRGVGEKMAQATEKYLAGLGAPPRNYAWEFNVIKDDATVNAWCMPGGKVAFYTGILPHTQNGAGVAVVMGHEFGHVVAQHGNERMSQAMVMQVGGAALSVALQQQPELTQQIFLQSFGAVSQVGVLLPYSRKHELEADRLGLTLMAAAGYDPSEAIAFWERMNALGGDHPPAFLSTHPPAQARIDAMKQHLPEALAVYAQHRGP